MTQKVTPEHRRRFLARHIAAAARRICVFYPKLELDKLDKSQIGSGTCLNSSCSITYDPESNS
jgi:hypothetical protein